MMTKVDEIMRLVDALIEAIHEVNCALKTGTDAEYEAAEIAVDRARADIKDALIAYEMQPKERTFGWNGD